ncbi:GntR family transcriptional regulator [Nocardioides marmoriginsengisoli]|uniref:GntR family transcriptional regulator n=1 Tax=Nocardioides marmoriginsengisoli TaxID=661483 RepID=A0A3N0CHT0_9ACTN|nr:GntR family transcriptional regulator [Nocardioides marmoriginsengisoli]RNL62596.1 GntR family transcriptional regulator [Nocardioides marmoriginsengisoli]
MPDSVITGMTHVPALLLVGTDDTNLDRTSQAYRAIRRQIIDLTLPPGSSFTESSLAQQWNISKTPVREALARLRRDGLVNAMPRAGYVVSPVTLEDTDDLCGLRTLLSSEGAAVAARNGLDNLALDQLDAFAEVPVALAQGDTGLEESLRAGIGFEAIVANGAENNRLGKAIVDVIDELERVLRMVALIAPNASSPPGELRAIAEQLRERNEEGAREAMAKRCERVRRDVLKVLAKSASVSRAPIEMPPPVTS